MKIDPAKDPIGWLVARVHAQEFVIGTLFGALHTAGITPADQMGDHLRNADLPAPVKAELQGMIEAAKSLAERAEAFDQAPKRNGFGVIDGGKDD